MAFGKSAAAATTAAVLLCVATTRRWLAGITHGFLAGPGRLVSSPSDSRLDFNTAQPVPSKTPTSRAPIPSPGALIRRTASAGSVDEGVGGPRRGGHQEDSTGNDDLELIERARAGDDAAFEALVRTHYDTLWRMVWALVRDDAHTESLLQEAFLEAHEALHGVSAGVAFPVWLRRIALECAMRFVRPHWNPPSTLLGMTETARADRPADDQAHRMVGSCMQNLPFALRAPICLKLEGLRHAEIAKILDLPVDTIQNRLFLSRDALGKCLRSKRSGHVA